MPRTSFGPRRPLEQPQLSMPTGSSRLELVCYRELGEGGEREPDVGRLGCAVQSGRVINFAPWNGRGEREFGIKSDIGGARPVLLAVDKAGRYYWLG